MPQIDHPVALCTWWQQTSSSAELTHLASFRGLWSFREHFSCSDDQRVIVVSLEGQGTTEHLSFGVHLSNMRKKREIKQNSPWIYLKPQSGSHTGFLNYSHDHSKFISIYLNFFINKSVCTTHSEDIAAFFKDIIRDHPKTTWSNF